LVDKLKLNVSADTGDISVFPALIWVLGTLEILGVRQLAAAFEGASKLAHSKAPSAQNQEGRL
jgi:hypothetical protein